MLPTRIIVMVNIFPRRHWSTCARSRSDSYLDSEYDFDHINSGDVNNCKKTLKCMCGETISQLWSSTQNLKNMNAKWSTKTLHIFLVIIWDNSAHNKAPVFLYYQEYAIMLAFMIKNINLLLGHLFVNSSRASRF